jgi:hypothetical protein
MTEQGGPVTAEWWLSSGQSGMAQKINWGRGSRVDGGGGNGTKSAKCEEGGRNRLSDIHAVHAGKARNAGTHEKCPYLLCLYILQIFNILPWKGSALKTKIEMNDNNTIR